MVPWSTTDLVSLVGIERVATAFLVELIEHVRGESLHTALLDRVRNRLRKQVLVVLVVTGEVT